MTNTKAISYTHPNRPAVGSGSVRLALTPGMSSVWITGPRAGQRAEDVPAKISYRKGV